MTDVDATREATSDRPPGGFYDEIFDAGGQPASAGPLRAGVVARLRAFARRHRTPITVVASVAATAGIVALILDRRHEFSTAISQAALWVLGVAVVLQIVALLARTEAWHVTIEAAGGTVPRRVLYRASGVQVLGGMLNGHLGVAARIAALRRSSPEISPQVPTLVAAELPIMAVEAGLGALTSFTLIGPLGLPWWVPLLILLLIGGISAGLRHLAQRKTRELWRGLAVLRNRRGAALVIGFILIAVFAQISRNWMLLHAVGIHASFFDSIAVLIGLITLSQLPIGPSVGAATIVLILGRDGVAAAAAAGVLTTATGTAGGLCFALWSGSDHLWSARRRAKLQRAAR
jgi:uncharacterized membrane protein YbhN (UPF0104 family)